MPWISVRNWRRFQHYDVAKRQPIWIKTYTELLDDDAYRDLTMHQRAVLHGLWLAYASSRCQLAVNTASLSARLNLRVTSRQLEALNHAGWVDIVASKTLADGYQDASPEVEVEEEKNLGVDVGRNGRTTTNEHQDFTSEEEEQAQAKRATELAAAVTRSLHDIPF